MNKPANESSAPTPCYDDLAHVANNIDPIGLLTLISRRAEVVQKGGVLNNGFCVHGNILLMPDGTVRKIKPSTYPRRDRVNTAFAFITLDGLSRELDVEITLNNTYVATPPEGAIEGPAENPLDKVAA